MIVPELRQLPNGSVELRFPYHAGIVDELKVTIPAWSRSYNPLTKVWTVEQPYATLAAGLMRRAFGHVRTVGAPAGPDPFTVYRGDASDPDLIVLHLRDTAPPELVEAAYKTLARLHHPDRGGSTTRMQELNAAYARLRERPEVGR